MSPDSFTGPLPTDNHVHSEFSWDAQFGSMERTCARAVELGLPSLAFTEHADFSLSPLHPTSVIPDYWQQYLADGVIHPPAIDVPGYLTTLERCRDRFPQLRILSGVELSEPHWHGDRVADLLTRGAFDRVLASMHSASLRTEDYYDVIVSIRESDGPTTLRRYYAEAERLIAEFDGYEVLTHLDYPFRYFPEGHPVPDPGDFEPEIRAVLRALARAGKVMEYSTRLPMDPRFLVWWREEGGRAVSFASDAHRPDAVAHGFRAATAVASAAGFRAGRDLADFWVRD